MGHIAFNNLLSFKIARSFTSSRNVEKSMSFISGNAGYKPINERKNKQKMFQFSQGQLQFGNMNINKSMLKVYPGQLTVIFYFHNRYIHGPFRYLTSRVSN